MELLYGIYKNVYQTYTKHIISLYRFLIGNIIITNNINLEMIKIPGHSGIYENEYIDKMIKDAHNDNYLSLEIKYDDIDNLNAIPRWNNVIINQNLRKFISLISKVKGFEKFFNLGRNAKY